MRAPFALALALLFAVPAAAQDMTGLPPAPPQPAADSADVASPEALVAAVYASLDREPGGQHDWGRFLSLYAPAATLLPNPEQTGGEPRAFSPQGYVDFIEGLYASVGFIGSANDQGFTERELHNVTHRFGDVAVVFSTYEKFRWDDDRSLGRGINSFQLIRRDGRWSVVAAAWDEEVGAGPIPAAYLPAAAE